MDIEDLCSNCNGLCFDNVQYSLHKKYCKQNDTNMGFFQQKSQVNMAAKLIKDILYRSKLETLGVDIVKSALCLCNVITKHISPNEMEKFKKKFSRKPNKKRKITTEEEIQ